mmetsp:Transcript_62909/g.194751  ORF Transcript_62909/g.194751 Transcript_62909/m.194751 type:complete len:164 (-) Transcript_62909:102-593(-)|eukprot:CAMPEP_0204578088 /NCGR_PEP_ID=MMETSP0661-20131031/42723_1 /ASSEMBLY_ACC=CAM_ASM_000606 /TAXON_ID=109239 /ORGANISM="Alexandrium margalefi, Strain AMGDE01CS-322" /LENGTH=163 /DNA_ID=CAMNT_0051586985 /DNA_START=53 /DNA_END=544 /DNA_ORIENTATION=-
MGTRSCLAPLTKEEIEEMERARNLLNQRMQAMADEEEKAKQRAIEDAMCKNIYMEVERDAICNPRPHGYKKHFFWWPKVHAYNMSSTPTTACDDVFPQQKDEYDDPAHGSSSVETASSGRPTGKAGRTLTLRPNLAALALSLRSRSRCGVEPFGGDDVETEDL